jgi:hypothetical protein
VPSSSRLRRLAILTLVVASIGPAAAPVAAAGPPTPPEDTSSGRVGIHHLVDSTATPGARCRYGYQVDTPTFSGYFNGLRRVIQRAPVAYARVGRASQRISYRLLVQAWDGAAWRMYLATRWQWRTATPTDAADFTERALTTDPWNDANFGPFRARVVLRWHAANGVDVVGQAALHPRTYLAVEGSLVYLSTDHCSGTTG